MLIMEKKDYFFCLLILLTLDSFIPVHAATGKFAAKTTFKCPLEFGIFPNPNNCRRFYTCNLYVPYDTPCPTPLYYDDARKMCVYKTEELQCGVTAIVSETTPIPDTAPSCDPSLCELPDCFCSEHGTQIPGSLMPKDAPQIVILTFSGTLNVLHVESFLYLFNETVNPNGCPIKATFFVSHEDTSHYYVQKLYSQGFEIAMQSMTNRSEDFWAKATVDEWVEEIVGLREILHIFSNVSKRDLLGLRAPYLKQGANNMMTMMYNYGLLYDSSIVSHSDIPLWPYTLDFKMPHECFAEKCPTRSFPGIWEFPLNTFHAGDDAGGSCVLLDQCALPDDPEVIFNALLHNFQTHYDSNRAPYLINLDVDWMTDVSKLSALDFFMEHVLDNYPNTWFLTMQQAIAWIRNPVPARMAGTFESWECSTNRQPACHTPRTCIVKIDDGPRSDFRYMQTCAQCPEKYPWLSNIRGVK